MERQQTVTQVTCVVVLYWCVSILLVFINKHILSGSYGINDLSIFVAWYQGVVAVSFIQLLGLIFKNFRTSTRLPSLDINTLLHSDMLKLSLSFVASLTFNNLMLKHIGIAFYQVARSSTLIFTILLSICVLKKPISVVGSLACILIIIGFSIGIDQEDVSGTLSVWGIIYGLSASLSTAICGIYFKQAEPLVDQDSLKMAYYNNANSCWIFLPLVFSSGQIHQVMSSDATTNPSFWMFLTTSGILSLSIGWVSALQIKYTSPVTHHISINAKSVTQTIIAILYYQEHKTWLWWGGNFLVIVGILLYAYNKLMTEKKLNTEGNSSRQLPQHSHHSENKSNII